MEETACYTLSCVLAMTRKRARFNSSPSSRRCRGALRGAAPELCVRRSVVGHIIIPGQPRVGGIRFYN